MGRLKNSYCFKMLKYLLLLSCVSIIIISSKPNSDQSDNDSASFIATAYSNTEIGNDVQNWKQVNNLEFIENRGQIVDTDGNPRPDIAYVADGNGVKLYFTSTGVSYVFTMIEKSEQKNVSKFDPGFRGFDRDELEESKVTTYRMDMKLLNSNPDVKIYAAEEAEGYFNYYYAHCPDGILGVKAYKRLVFENIYDNIDLVFYDSEKGMEYDFVVKPGGKVQDIRFQYEGAEQVSLLENEKLKVVNPLGQIIENAPRTYTMRNYQGMTAKRNHDTIVKCFYRLENNIINFEVSNFDTDQTLIIDPELSWATYYGGSGHDTGKGVATDENGNMVITGYTYSMNFPVSNGFQPNYGGVQDVFIIKFSSNGSREWATYYGGSSYDHGTSIAIDENGNMVITGQTYSKNFPITNNAFQSQIEGSNDAFIVKFTSSGSREWATYYGGSDQDNGYGVAFDGSGNVVITGWTMSNDFPVTSGAFQTSNAGEPNDAFIVKFTNSGSRQWATYYGGDRQDEGIGVAIDENGNVVIAGITASTNLPVPMAFQQTNKGGYNNHDAFIAKFDSSGLILWATYYGGSEDDQGWGGVATDSDGNVLITGKTYSNDFPVTSGAFQTNWAGGWDVFIVKLDSDGKRQWATYYGGNEGRLPDDEGFGIATDKNGNVLITGRTTTTNFPVTNDAFQTNYGGGDFDVFIIKFTGNGIRQWASYYGGDGTDQGFGIATNSEGNVFITGDASSTNLPTTGAIQDSLVGSLDAFVAKFTSLNFLLAITNAPSEITMTSAMLNGTVYTRGDTTKVYFKYDTTQVDVNFDSVKAIQSPIIGITMVSVTAPLTNLLPNTTYYFRVVAEDNDGINDGADSTFTTPGPLEAPALSFPANGSIDISPIPTLRWNTVTGATSYRLQIARYSDFSTTVLNEGGITESSKTISGLASETRYHWRVQAFREGIASDSSAWSNVWNFTTGTKWILEHNVFFPSYGNPSDYRQTDYRIIGLPGANDVLVNSLFSGTQGKDWQVYRDNGNVSTNPEDYFLAYDGLSHFLLGNGRAFWMINKGPLNINTSVDPPSMDNSNHAVIQLHEGWNLITNPFLTTVNWSDVKQANGIVEPIWKYNGTNGFDSLTTIFEPYIGYYFDAPSDLNSLKIPSPYVLQKKSVLAEEDPAMWRVRMILSCGEFRDRTTSFGVAQNSSREFDRLDFCKPRSVATSPIVSFYRPQWDHNYSTFATDIRPEFDEIEGWDFEVRRVHQQNSKLEFKGIEQIPKPMEIYLVDEGRGKYINLREQSSYNFRGIGDIMKFWIIVGKSEAVKDKLSEINMPKQFSLGNNYPNPFNPATTIPIEIPVVSDVTLRIYNILGQEVKTVYEGHIEVGQYQFTWDGKDQAGNRLASGVYILQLSTNIRISLTSKMILMQ